MLPDSCGNLPARQASHFGFDSTSPCSDTSATVIVITVSVHLYYSLDEIQKEATHRRLDRIDKCAAHFSYPRLIHKSSALQRAVAHGYQDEARSEERRVGKECGSTERYRRAR